jgi:hypothetical protein
MKIFFVKEDSLLKIFKTLEKIQKWKNVEITIDPEHPLFDNERWWRQIKEVLEKRWINATFITKTEKSRIFFQKLWFNVNHTEQNKFVKIFRMIFIFFFDIKKLHINMIKWWTWKKYNQILIFSCEILILLLILWFAMSLFIHRAKIEINPSQQSETIIYNFRYYPAENTDYPRYSRFLSIPFYTWSIDYTYEMTINTSNIKYLQNPSIWEVKIFNKSNESFKLVPNTRFVTEDWKLFQSKTWIEIPAGYEWTPWEVVVKLQAMEKDENDIMMWNRWNISKWTTLYIRNLKQSYFLKNIYAVAIDNFEWWSLESEWTITQNDIDMLSWKLETYIQQQKKNIISQNFNINNAILLTFGETTKAKTKSINIPHSSWENNSIIKWSITSNIEFLYIQRNDLISAYTEYMTQRPSDKTKLISIDKSSLAFYNDDEITETDWTFIVPTKIEVIQGYDFSKDINRILDEIKTHIVSIDKEEARSYILSFPEVASTKIKVSPSRYWSMPKVKSKIKILINN